MSSAPSAMKTEPSFPAAVRDLTGMPRFARGGRFPDSGFGSASSCRKREGPRPAHLA